MTDTLDEMPVKISVLSKEVIGWILVIGLFTSLLTYQYIWPQVVISTFQLISLWIVGSLLTLTPFFDKYFRSINMRYEQDLLTRFVFIVPAFICLIFIVNYFLPVYSFRETHQIVETYDVTIHRNKRDETFVMLVLKENAYSSIKKVRMVHPMILPDNPTQITYSFERGILGIKTIKGRFIQ